MTAAIPRDLATLCAGAVRGAALGLDPATAPAALAEQHRREVAEYLERRPGAGTDEVAEALVLPRWNVERARAALAGAPEPVVARRSYRTANRTAGGWALRPGRKECGA